MAYRCDSCKKTGHIAEKRLSGTVEVRTCDHCKRGGHLTKDCFLRKYPNGVVPVYNCCGKRGHHAENCFSGIGEVRICQHCGKKGHLAEHCYFKKYDVVYFCDFCRKPGHKTDSCQIRIYGKVLSCEHCGRKGHTEETCYEIMGKKKGRQMSRSDLAREAAKKAARPLQKKTATSETKQRRKNDETATNASHATSTETDKKSAAPAPVPANPVPNQPKHVDKPRAATIENELNPVIEPRLRRILPFNADLENPGLAAWREGAKPTLIHRFPKNFDPMVFDNPSNKYDRLQGIAEETRTYIIRRKAHDLAIWGSVKDADKAISLINAWVEEYDLPKAGPSADWAKISSPTPEAQQRLHKKIEREIRRNAWRRPPGMDAKYEFQYRILWNPTGTPWRLEDYLGQNLEALDPIRMDCRCHIVFARDKDEPFFALVGDNEDKMQVAVERMQNIQRQVLARQLNEYSFYLVKPFPSNRLRRIIRYQPYIESGNLQTGSKGKEVGVTMSLCGDFLSDKERTDYDGFPVDTPRTGTVLLGTPRAKSVNVFHANIWIMKLLENLKYFNGFLQMRVKMGTPIFIDYRISHEKRCDIGQFKEDLEDCNLQEGGLKSRFNDELGNKELESGLLAKFQAATDLLSDASTSSFGTFTFPHPNKGNYQYRLEIELKANGNDSDLVSQKWYRLEPCEDGFTNVMDINFLDLETPHASYNLAVSRCHSFLDTDHEQTLPGLYRSFANGMTMNCERAQDPSDHRQFIRYPLKENTMKEPKVPIKEMQQKRSWRFTVKGSAYEVEVSTIQKIEYSYKPFDLNAYEQRWAVQVWHPSWDVNLGENAQLSIGEGAKWEAKEWYFFPPKGMYDLEMEGMVYEKGSGCAELLRVLGIVESIIMGDGPGDLTPRLTVAKLANMRLDEGTDAETETETDDDTETATASEDGNMSIHTVWEDEWAS